jgi:hypothetical protein
MRLDEPTELFETLAVDREMGAKATGLRRYAWGGGLLFVGALLNSASAFSAPRTRSPSSYKPRSSCQ